MPRPKSIFLGYTERLKAYRVYNSETQCVEESTHIKFDDKEPGSEIPELVESFADIQVSEDTSEPDQTPEFDDSPEVEPTPEVHNEEASDVAQDGSQQAVCLCFRQTMG
jgi:hypothetical protein